MVYDAAGIEFGHQIEPNLEEPQNMEATKFYDMLNSAQQPLWPG